MSTKTALITGASSGIGAVYADRLARRGYDLVLVARRADRLQAVADQIHAATGRQVRLLTADLSERSGQAKVEAELAKGGIDVLVNNAGIAAITPLVASDVEHMTQMIETNVTALTRLTYAAVPAMLRQGGGTIINIASIVAIGPEVLNGVYGASKAYVLAFTQSLQHELAGQGIRVQAVLPGATATEIWETAGTSHTALPQEIVMKTDAMVDAALVGLDAGEVVTIPPLQDGADWDQHEASRRALAQKFGNAQPGARYLKA